MFRFFSTFSRRGGDVVLFRASMQERQRQQERVLKYYRNRFGERSSSSGNDVHHVRSELLAHVTKYGLPTDRAVRVMFAVLATEVNLSIPEPKMKRVKFAIERDYDGVTHTFTTDQYFMHYSPDHLEMLINEERKLLFDQTGMLFAAYVE